MKKYYIHIQYTHGTPTATLSGTPSRQYLAAYPQPHIGVMVFDHPGDRDNYVVDVPGARAVTALEAARLITAAPPVAHVPTPSAASLIDHVLRRMDICADDAELIREMGLVDDLADYDLCWCETGKTASGHHTTRCADCVYQSACEAIDDYCEQLQDIIGQLV